MQSWCNSSCQSNVTQWLSTLNASCTIPTNQQTAIANELMNYCLAHCGSSNPWGVITQADVQIKRWGA